MDYRARIYGRYVTGRSEQLAPLSIAGFQPRAPYLFKLIREHFPPNKNANILELGCGHGALIYFARWAGYKNIRGVDGSQEQVWAGLSLGVEGLEHADLMPTLKGLPDGSQDSVIAFDVIEHLNKSEILSFVDEVQRVLRPQGRFILHTSNAEAPFFGESFHGDFTHEVCFTQKSLGQVLLTAGFGQLHCFEDQPVPHGVKSFVRWVIWKFIRAGLRLWTAAETGDTGKNAIFSRNFLAVAVKA